MSKWVKQYDPNEGRDYYWNSETGEAVWDEPEDFGEGGKSEEMDAALRLQSLFRGSKVCVCVHACVQPPRRSFGHACGGGCGWLWWLWRFVVVSASPLGGS